jgi:flagellar biosynthesis protein FlhF
MEKEKQEALEITIDEIRAFKKEILLMHGVLAGDMVEGDDSLRKVSDFFVKKGLDRAWLDRVLSSFVGTEVEQDESLLFSYVLEELDNYILTQKEPQPIEKKIQILIGATGVGKTTLMGKLGARYQYLLEKQYRVVFCNNDKVKLGAIEQLSHYSDAMDIGMIEVENLMDEREADIILVDTAGVSTNAVDGLFEWITLLSKNQHYKVEVSLVLSANQRVCNMVDLMGLYKKLDIDNFIFTKLDETRDIGEMIRFLMQYQKPIGYLSMGQEIPEDLMVATNKYILEKFMREVEVE